MLSLTPEHLKKTVKIIKTTYVKLHTNDVRVYKSQQYIKNHLIKEIIIHGIEKTNHLKEEGFR